MEQPDALVARAREAMTRAYAPYSRFRVGAALETDDGRIYVGCNVENASYGVTMCAERVAVGSAIVGGARRVRRIAVTTETEPPIPPCGACRQVLVELGTDVEIVAAGPSTMRRWTLQELLPAPFTRESRER